MSYSSEVLADSPLLYWRMDAGGTDSSGNGRDATSGVNGTSTTGLLASDPSSPAVQFNGTTQHLRENYGAWMAVSTFTVECWIKTTATTQQYIVARDDAGTNRVWALAHSLSGSAGKPYFVRLKNSSGTLTAEVAQGTTSINDGNPHHLVGTYDGTSLRLYVDGSLQATTTASGGLFSSTVWLDVASLNDGGNNYFNGVIDEVAYYGSVLSSTRISAHYTAGSTPASAAASGTALLSLSASGGAGATGGGSASLSLSASGGTSAAAGGSASLSLSATGSLTPPVPADGGASLSLSASGGASGAPGGTASLNLIATGTAIAVLAASGSATLTLTASGSAVMSAGGSAFLTLSAGGVALALYETDTSNALDGLDLLLTATVIMPVAIAPAPTGLAERYDVAIPYPVPVVNGGRVE